MSGAEIERWQISDLVIDVGGQLVTRGVDAIPLPQLSFKFLLALVRAAPNVLSVDDLMDQVWAGIYVNTETVKQRAKLLRDALGDDPKTPHYFSVRRGVGYQLLSQPVRVNPSGAIPPLPHTTPAKRRSKGILAFVALCVAALGGLTMTELWSGRHSEAQSHILRVAVLPFDNLSSDPADAFIARSIPEMVLNRLSAVGGLTVIARESSLLGPAAGASPKEAGAQLDAGYIVKGSVQRVGNLLRVTCFVVDTRGDVRLWSERFDWPVDRLYALQDRIADHVTESLEARARGLGALAPISIATHNSDAYLAYLKGKSLLGRFTVAETDAAAVQFERAVKYDPDFVDALAALFDARMQGADLRKDDLAPYRARYQPLIDKALARNPDSGPALFAKAMWSDVPAKEREQLFRRAAELDPSNSRGLTAFAEFLDRTALRNNGAIGQEGKPLIDKVLSIDPLSPRTRWWSVQRRWSRLPPQQVEKLLAHELEIDPQNYILANRYAFRRWMFHGETAEAIALIERTIVEDPQNPLGPHFAAAFYLDVNDPSAARAVAATTPASRDSTRVLFAEYTGDWRRAASAAYDRRGFLFNEYSNWGWAEAIRDDALRNRQYDRAAEQIASRYGFDLRQPRVTSIAQMIAAPPLAHILLTKGDKATGTHLLADMVRWIDTHPSYGLGGIMRYRAAAMMLLGDRAQALSNLRASIETGHDIRHWWYLIDRDPIWAPIHGDPRFTAIADMCRQAARAQRAKLDDLRRAGTVPVRS
jgi:TolB-like protein/DNA-binding winged helix-turn-helix (wHTH) protein